MKKKSGVKKFQFFAEISDNLPPIGKMQKFGDPKKKSDTVDSQVVLYYPDIFSE